MVHSGKLYDSFQEYAPEAFQPTDRFSVRASVYLPSSDVDPRTGMLRQDIRRRGRTQALRMAADRLDKEFAQLDATLEARYVEKSIHISLRTAVAITFILIFLLGTVLLVQQGTLSRHLRRINSVNQKNETLQSDITLLQAKIAEASDAATICYAAARNIGMVPAASTQAIHLTSVDTRPVGPTNYATTVVAQEQDGSNLSIAQQTAP